MANTYIKLTTGELLLEVVTFLDHLKRLPTDVDEDCPWIYESATELQEALIQRFPEYELDEH